MKLVAHDYLYDIIYPTVKAMYKDKRSLEIDPHKADKGEDVKKNDKFLIDTLTSLLNRIYDSENDLPKYFESFAFAFISPLSSLRIIFQHLMIEVERRFPTERNARYIGVSSFLFLRFIAAAILGPKMFDLMEGASIFSPSHSSSLTPYQIILSRKLISH